VHLRASSCVCYYCLVMLDSMHGLSSVPKDVTCTLKLSAIMEALHRITAFHLEPLAHEVDTSFVVVIHMHQNQLYASAMLMLWISLRRVHAVACHSQCLQTGYACEINKD